MLSFFAGIGIGLSLIVVIGAQNAFVLRQGIRREHVLPVVLVCALSDAVLILAGVAGLGYVVEAAPWLLVLARWAGALFLLGYGLLAARRAWRGGEKLRIDEPQETTAPASATARPVATATRTALAPAVLTVVALTWLNPHVYLDTVVLLGSVAATHGDGRWAFAFGTIVASFIWFTTLGFGARYLGRWLSTPRAWRLLDGFIAFVMIAFAISLVVPVL